MHEGRLGLEMRCEGSSLALGGYGNPCWSQRVDCCCWGRPRSNGGSWRGAFDAAVVGIGILGGVGLGGLVVAAAEPAVVLAELLAVVDAPFVVVGVVLVLVVLAPFEELVAAVVVE
jgi:hypothetical protein